MQTKRLHARGDVYASAPKLLRAAFFGSKRSRDGPGSSYSADSQSAAPPSKKVKMREIEIQTAEISKILEKRDKD